VSPRVAQKLRALERAGLLSRETYRRFLARLEDRIDFADFDAELSGDIDALAELAEMA
jgi:hypothetical protein